MKKKEHYIECNVRRINQIEGMHQQTDRVTGIDKNQALNLKIKVAINRCFQGPSRVNWSCKAINFHKLKQRRKNLQPFFFIYFPFNKDTLKEEGNKDGRLSLGRSCHIENDRTTELQKDRNIPKCILPTSNFAVLNRIRTMIINPIIDRLLTSRKRICQVPTLPSNNLRST